MTDDNPTDAAVESLEQLPDDAAFAVVMLTTDGGLNSHYRLADADPNRAGVMSLALLAAHIRGTTEQLEEPETPAETAQLALKKLHEMESNGFGLVEIDGGEG